MRRKDGGDRDGDGEAVGPPSGCPLVLTLFSGVKMVSLGFFALRCCVCREMQFPMSQLDVCGPTRKEGNKERRKIRSDDYRQMPKEARANGLRDVNAGSGCVVLHASLISRRKEN